MKPSLRLRVSAPMTRFAWLLTAALVTTRARAQPAPPPAPAIAQVADFTTRASRLLALAVRGSGVDYAALRADPRELDALCDWLGAHGPSSTPAAFATREARLAYWLNAYNLTVLRAVIALPEGARNVLTARAQGGFFRAEQHRVDGRLRTLDQIENVEIRPVFRDPRVHMALNCAAQSCPPLRNEAYTASALGAQLDSQVARYLAQPGAVRLDAAEGRLRVSQIFEWFADDFAASGGVVGFVAARAPRPLAAQITARCLGDAGACALTYEPYNWSLNLAR